MLNINTIVKTLAALWAAGTEHPDAIAPKAVTTGILKAEMVKVPGEQVVRLNFPIKGKGWAQAPSNPAVRTLGVRGGCFGREGKRIWFGGYPAAVNGSKDAVIKVGSSLAPLWGDTVAYVTGQFPEASRKRFLADLERLLTADVDGELSPQLVVVGYLTPTTREETMSRFDAGNKDLVNFGFVALQVGLTWIGEPDWVEATAEAEGFGDELEVLTGEAAKAALEASKNKAKQKAAAKYAGNRVTTPKPALETAADEAAAPEVDVFAELSSSID